VIAGLERRDFAAEVAGDSIFVVAATDDFLADFFGEGTSTESDDGVMTVFE